MTREQLLWLFQDDHLPDDLRAVARPYKEAAAKLFDEEPDSEQRDLTLRALLRARRHMIRVRLGLED